MNKLKIILDKEGNLSDIECGDLSLYEILPTIYSVDASLSRFTLSDEEIEEFDYMDNNSRIIKLFLVWDYKDLEVKVEEC